MKKSEIKAYYNSIKKSVKCERKAKAEFLSTLRDNISEYVRDYPDATPADLEKTFGTPDEISDSFLQSLDPDEIRTASNSKKIIVATAAICLVAVAAVTVPMITKQLTLYKTAQTNSTDKFDENKEVSAASVKKSQTLISPKQVVSSSTEKFDDGSFAVVSVFDDSDSADFHAVKGSKEIEYHNEKGTPVFTLTVNAAFKYNTDGAECVSGEQSYKLLSDTWQAEDVTVSRDGNKCTVSGNFTCKVDGKIINKVKKSVTLTCDADGNLS